VVRRSATSVPLSSTMPVPPGSVTTARSISGRAAPRTWTPSPAGRSTRNRVRTGADPSSTRTAVPRAATISHSAKVPLERPETPMP